MAALPFTINIRVVELIFEEKKVNRAVERMQRRNITRQLAFLRTRARSLLRRRKRPAKPGQPPSVHSSGAASLKNIQFDYDPVRKIGVVGPVKVGGVRKLSDKPGPTLMERGGIVRPKRKRRKAIQRYEEHPYMLPALRKEIEAGTVAKVWTNSLRSS